MPEFSTGHHKRCEFAVGASESLDKHFGVSPGANTEATARDARHRDGDGQLVQAQSASVLVGGS